MISKSSCLLSIVMLKCTLLFLTGCASKHANFMKSAHENYQANQYGAALRNTVIALKLKPNYDKAQDLVLTVFRAAVKHHEYTIKHLEKRRSRFKWDEIVYEYRKLIEINYLVESLPPAALVHKKTRRRIIFNTKDYTYQLDEASQNAAEVHYQEGIRIASSSDDVVTQKRAAKEFKKVEEFVRGYKDADYRYEKSRRAGVKKIAIMPFEDKSRKGRFYGALSDTITDRIVASVVNDHSATEFLELISRDQLDRVMYEQDLGSTGIVDRRTAASLGRVIGVHEIVIGKITQVIYVPARTRNITVSQRATLRVKSGTERYKDKKGRIKVRAKWVDKEVSAKVIHYTRESSASIIGSYQIIDVETAAIRDSARFDEKHEFKVEWGKFWGDERAMSNAYRNLCNAVEHFAPTEQEMVLEAADKLSRQLAASFKAYAR